MERIRYHVCWGCWHGSHSTDVPLKDIVDVVLQVHAGQYSVEAGNVRHEHEWDTVKLPEGKLLLPGGRYRLLVGNERTRRNASDYRGRARPSVSRAPRTPR